jgi:hypothetical protein
VQESDDFQPEMRDAEGIIESLCKRRALLHKSNFSTRCCGQAYSKSASNRFMQQRPSEV